VVSDTEELGSIIMNLPISGIVVDEGVELESSLSSRKNARNIFMPRPTVYTSSSRRVGIRSLITQRLSWISAVYAGGYRG